MRAKIQLLVENKERFVLKVTENISNIRNILRFSSNFDRLPYKSPYIHKCVNHILIPCQQVLILIILKYSEKPLGFFLRTAPNPTFCVPSQFVSWSAHPFEPPSETYVSALHDI